MNKDNQQEIPTESEIAWLAGVIECDGTISLSCYVRNEKGTKPKIGNEIKLYNTDAGVIAKATDIIERLGLKKYLYERAQIPMEMKDGKVYGDTSRIMLSVSVKNINDAYLLGKLLHPWMFGEKQHRLALMIQYLARRIEKFKENNGYKRIPLDKGDCELIVEFYKRFVKRKGHNRHLVEAILNDFT